MAGERLAIAELSEGLDVIDKDLDKARVPENDPCRFKSRFSGKLFTCRFEGDSCFALAAFQTRTSMDSLDSQQYLDKVRI